MFVGFGSMKSFRVRERAMKYVKLLNDIMFYIVLCASLFMCWGGGRMCVCRCVCVCECVCVCGYVCGWMSVCVCDVCVGVDGWVCVWVGGCRCVCRVCVCVCVCVYAVSYTHLTLPTRRTV